MYSDLSNRQIQVLQVIKDNISFKGYPPSVREICDKVGLKSTSTVHSHLNKLEKLGYIVKDATRPRAIAVMDDLNKTDVLDPATNMVSLPMVSRFCSDKGLLYPDDISGRIPLPKMMVKGRDPFIYINQGDSMRDFGILHNDYVLLDRTSTASDGELALVVLYGEFMSVKKYYRDGNNVVLKSNNDIVMDRSLVKVLGVVKGVIRV